MKQFFCDCCGKQTVENNLTSVRVNKQMVDLCDKCQKLLADKRQDAQSKVDIEFMKNMTHQPLSFKYNCE